MISFILIFWPFRSSMFGFLCLDFLVFQRTMESVSNKAGSQPPPILQWLHWAGRESPTRLWDPPVWESRCQILFHLLWDSKTHRSSRVPLPWACVSLSRMTDSWRNSSSALAAAAARTPGPVFLFCHVFLGFLFRKICRERFRQLRHGLYDQEDRVPASNRAVKSTLWLLLWVGIKGMGSRKRALLISFGWTSAWWKIFPSSSSDFRLQDLLPS